MSGGTLYGRFSVVYDREWRGLAHDLYRTVYRPVLRREVSGREPALDLCCGCGHVTSRLIADGYSVTGLDCSAAMLRIAAGRNPSARFVRADARRFRLPPTFAAAVACFDSLNYLRTRRHLLSCFRSVYRSLRPAGLFLFDLGTRYAFERYWTSQQVIRRAAYCCVLEKSFRPSSGIGALSVTTFLRSGRCWRRAEEVHALRAWEPRDVLQILARAGFQAVVRDAYTGRAVMTTTERVLLVARRR